MQELTDEQLAQVIDELSVINSNLDEIEQFYKKNKIVTFEALGGQPAFFESSAATRLVFGSNRSGKSVLLTVEEIAHALGYRPWLPEDHPNRIVRLANGKPIPVPNVGYHLLENLKISGTQVFLPKMQEWLPDIGAKIKKNQLGQPVRVEYPNGSVLHVLSQEMSVSAIEGANGHYACSDEPPKKEMWIALTRGLIDFAGNSWIAATPIKSSHYMAELMTRATDPEASVDLFSLSINDNRRSRGGYLDDKAVDNFIKSLPPEEIMARVHGKPSHLAGAVFPMWRPTAPYYVTPEEIPGWWPRVMAIDPAGRKPFAGVWMALSPDDIWYIYREVYDETLDTVRDVSNWIKYHEGWEWSKTLNKYIATEESEPIAIRIIDTSANARERTSGNTVTEAFWMNDLSFENAHKIGYLASINKIKEMLKYGENDFNLTPQIVVHNDCPRVAHEFMNFVWSPETAQSRSSGADAKDKPLKTNDDCIDCIRYIVMMNASFRGLVALLRRAGRDL
jgi:hypothetical protein